MTIPMEIETTRLILRTVTMKDVEQVASSWRLDEEPLSLTKAEEQVTWMLENHRRNAPGKVVHLCLAIVTKDTHEFIGWCGLDHRDRTRASPVLFYLLKAKYWGMGLATEAAEAVLRYAFDELGLAQVNGGAAFENLASKRVMEKLSMRYLGLDEEGGHSFTLTREEYLRNKARHL
jgi:ribosomal-protein-alanine N-acetyltransferase